MLAFYDSMIWRKSARRFYTLTFFLFLIAFHFYYLTIFKNHYDVIPSTALCYVLLSHKMFEKIIRFLQNPQIYFCAMMFSVACLFIPHVFTLGVSFGVIMIATVFYPAKWWENQLDDTIWLDKIYFIDNTLNRFYFSWHGPERTQADKDNHEEEFDTVIAESVENPRLPFVNTDIEDVEYEMVDELCDMLTTPNKKVEFKKSNLNLHDRTHESR